MHVALHWQSAGGTGRWFLCSVGKDVTVGCSTRHTQRKNVSHLMRMGSEGVWSECGAGELVWVAGCAGLLGRVLCSMRFDA